MKVNLLLAFSDTNLDKATALIKSARQKLENEVQGNLTAKEQLAMKLFRRSVFDLYRRPTIAGTRYTIFDIVVEDHQLSRLDEIDGVVVVGAWNVDGTQYGQTLSYDTTDPENVKEVITGTPVYPIHPNLRDFVPDEVEYNTNGTEKSRKRPIQLKQVHKYLGWADRRWT